MSGADQATAPDQHSPPATRHPGGRPKVWTDERRAEAIDHILEAIADGNSLTDVLKAENMPGYTTVCQWLREDPHFAKDYARAREAAADVFEAKVIETAERCLTDKAMDPQAARVAIDALKWAAAKRKPKVYGDQIDINHTVTDKRVGWVIDLTEKPAGPVIEGDLVQPDAQIPAQGERNPAE